ncbi:MAG: sporulation protein [Nitrococcus sp.]|nr:sporulation protein [Nitrococcus sp.]
MSFLKRTLASVGIGAARVDTILDSERTHPGSELSGTIHIQGGDLAQEIEHIELSLVTRYLQEIGADEAHVNHPLSQTRLRERFEVQPGATLDLPFTLQVPWETPLTLGRTLVWVNTALSVSLAVDPSDRDALRVEPTPGMLAILEALGQLGFTLYKADCEQNRRLGRSVPFVQELEFRPGGRYAGRLKELEVVLAPEPGGVRVWMEADLRARGLAGALLGELDLNERFAQAYFNDSQLAHGTNAIAPELARIIDTRLH